MNNRHLSTLTEDGEMLLTVTADGVVSLWDADANIPKGEGVLVVLGLSQTQLNKLRFAMQDAGHQQ